MLLQIITKIGQICSETCWTRVTPLVDTKLIEDRRAQHTIAFNLEVRLSIQASECVYDSAVVSLFH